MDGVTTGAAGVNSLEQRPSCSTTLLAICRPGRGETWLSRHKAVAAFLKLTRMKEEAPMF